MSTLYVRVSKIDNVIAHPNADSLDLCTVEGYQCVTAKGLRKTGDKIVYVPVDSIMPLELSDKMDVTKYLSNGRVRCAKLRGEPSFGVLMEPADPTWEIGQDVKDFYGITKYIPPVKASAGDAETPHALLPKYTDIENMRHFLDAFSPEDDIVLTEKVHGTNCKVGIIGGEEMAASMDVRRKRPLEDQMASNIYWFPFTVPGVKQMLTEMAAMSGNNQVILYGEVFGSKVQNLDYGLVGKLGFRAFDLMVNGKYVDYDVFSQTCKAFNIPIVPEIARGKYSIEFVRQHSGGKTTLNSAQHIREGVVVKPLKETTHPKLGRLVLKYISDEYLLRKAGGKITDSQDE